MWFPTLRDFFNVFKSEKGFESVKSEPCLFLKQRELSKDVPVLVDVAVYYSEDRQFSVKIERPEFHSAISTV